MVGSAELGKGPHMLKRLTPLPIVALVALSACGGDDDAAPTTPSAPAPTVPVTTVAPTPPAPPTAPAPTTAPSTAAPTTAAPTTAPATAAPTTVAETAPAGPGDGAAAGEAITVVVPGAVELTNEVAVAAVTALQEFGGLHGDVSAQLTQLGLDVGPHVVIEQGALFELTGGVDATFGDESDYNVELSYVVQSDEPDPEAVLAAVQDGLSGLGDYEVSTSTRSQDDLTAYFVDLRPADYSSGLPTWNLSALDLGASDEEWAGIVELHIETYGTTSGFTVPDALADLDAEARSESPLELTPFKFRVDNSINMFGGFPSSSARIDYRVDATDIAAAHEAFSAALADTYGDPFVDDDGDFASWDDDGRSWSVHLDFEDRVVAYHSQSRY